MLETESSYRNLTNLHFNLYLKKNCYILPSYLSYQEHKAFDYKIFYFLFFIMLLIAWFTIFWKVTLWDVVSETKTAFEGEQYR